jgi:hypothetical protein
MRLVLGAVILASMTSVASAGGTYIGLGIGSESTGGWERTDGAMYSGSMDGYGRSGRLMLGRSFGKLSVEGQASRFNVTVDQPHTATQLAAALKLSIPLGSGFEFFGKGGLERTWLSEGTLDAAGNGWLLGLGFEYRLNLGATAASIFVDYQRTSSAFEFDETGGRMTSGEFDGVMSMWTLGATVSL